MQSFIFISNYQWNDFTLPNLTPRNPQLLLYTHSLSQNVTDLRSCSFSLESGERLPRSGESNEATREVGIRQEGLPPFDQSISISATGRTGKIYSGSQELVYAEFRNLWPKPPTPRVKDRASFKTDKVFSCCGCAWFWKGLPGSAHRRSHRNRLERIHTSVYTAWSSWDLESSTSAVPFSTANF